jgi:hypothetical protein
MSMRLVHHVNTADAEEWFNDLQDSFGFALLQNTIDIAVIVGESEDELEAVSCYNALAAIEILTALHNQASPHLPPEISVWVTDHQRLSVPQDLAQQAQKALFLIRQTSELRNLWQDSPQFAQWLAQLDELEQRLARC